MSRNIIILNTMVGPFERGRIVSLDDPHLSGVDIGRLINLKAVEYVNEPATETPLPLGPANQSTPPAKEEKSIVAVAPIEPVAAEDNKTDEPKVESKEETKEESTKEASKKSTKEATKK